MTMHKDKRIVEIHQLLIELASGNFSSRGKLTENIDDLDAIIIGINTLSEELLTSTYSRDYLNSIFKGIVDMTIVLNSDDIIQRVNEPVCKLLLYDKEELIGQPFSKLLLCNKEHYLNKVKDKLNTDGFCYDIEARFIKKDGSDLPVSFSGSLLYDKKDLTHGKLFIAKDITRIKKTEYQLKQKNTELNTFIYKASHDLKGPLASTLGLVNLAKDENNIQQLKEYLDLIEKSTKRLDAILIGLSEVARASQSVLNEGIVDFNQLINEALSPVKQLPEYDGVDIKVTILQKKEFISDFSILKSILSSLFENSIKYKKCNTVDPYLSITITDKEKGVEMEVSDNGIGIPKDIHSEIFNMFYRGTSNPAGSGLGLYIVKAGVEKLNGKISVESNINEGATFRVFIPG